MDLSNRDIAFLVWFGAAAIAVLVWRPGRQAIRAILDSLRGKLLAIALIYTAYFEGTMDATAQAVDDVLDDASFTELVYSDDDAEDPDEGR